jgi:hypothetical protein
MNLHANAALNLNRRRQLCRRVVDQRWTLTQGATAAEVSPRCARKWAGATAPRASSAYSIVLRRRMRSLTAPTRGACVRSRHSGGTYSERAYR